METTRYNRQIILPEVGTEGQAKLLQAKVLLAGAGGLGATVLPYLVAAGVGEIGLIDDDIVAISNLQRQVIYKTSSVGETKVIEAQKMALALNPDIKINIYNEKLTSKNAISLFENYDIVVDATDNLSTKYLINDASIVTKTPFVYGSVFKFEGQVSVFNYQNGPSYRCLFPNKSQETKNCNESGVLGTSVGLIGMLQANEVLKMILGIGEVLSGELLVYNLLTNDQQKYSFSKSDVKVMSVLDFEEKYNNFIEEISAFEALELANSPEVFFLDVRNFDETPQINLPNSIQIPLDYLEKELSQLDSNLALIVFCQSGIRSKKAVELLRKYDFKNVKSIIGGAIAIEKINKETVAVF
ncbi:ThiF family adenylyltransferase [Flavobacterium sp.]|uniref:ThiF family adenylyltransferase n=1 Tax=Flavobacterium sp. TaxID=239 RepID=UPI0038FD045F